MGNCLCDEADEYMAYNRLHDLEDPHLQPEWLRRHHPLFQHDGINRHPWL